MKKTSSDSPSSTDRIRFWARSKAHGPSTLPNDQSRPTLPISNPPSDSSNTATQQSSSTNAEDPNDNDTTRIPPFASAGFPGFAGHPSKPTTDHNVDDIATSGAPRAPSSQVEGTGSVVEDEKEKPTKKNVVVRFWLTTKSILLSSYINILLVFVPIGIAAECAKLSPGIIFAMNAIAIVPLAGLLSHATESVAKRMGDTIGALMNVTFGNAVELIIFIIALSKGQIRIVQASLLGSILANLLLILGMCFLVGGLRYREQIYNSTVTQMSACLLSLSVMSLLLPTAFHASFSEDVQPKASRAVLKVSRGTSVILLFVYVLYLLFQLKSHAYMYESTPQHIIDEESAPGPVAQWMESSSDSSSSSSSSDSDDSSGSNGTAKRFKRVMRGHRRRRKSSVTSGQASARIEPSRTPSFGATDVSAVNTTETTQEPQHAGRRLDPIDFGEEGDIETHNQQTRKNPVTTPRSKKEIRKERKRREQEKKDRKKARRNRDDRNGDDTVNPEQMDGVDEKAPVDLDAPRRVDFAVTEHDPLGEQTDSSQKRPFNIRNITSIRPQIPKTFTQNVFMQPLPTPQVDSGPIPRVRYGIRRTNSLPDRLNSTASNAMSPATRITPGRVNSLATAAIKPEGDDENISRTTAVFLLLISTGLVAVCAEFMVDNISAMVEGNSGVSEAFIGLIILPIVGNAAEHVTAVTVASKNKMDLAIGVAVGSSIQIALFVTPFVVLLGWAMGQNMSLYFTLFETVCLFVSAFIVNFLILDGRSNYLEGALLCAAYVVIAVAAFFYPDVDEQSNLGGASVEVVRRAVGGLLGV